MDEKKLCEFLMEAGVKLQARCTTTSTAIVLLHKFMNSVSSDINYCPYTAAAACMYLAGKAEEDLLKIRDIINVCYRILHPNEAPLEVGDLFYDLREGIGKLEMLILRTVQFKLIHAHPHKICTEAQGAAQTFLFQYLLHYLNSLQSWLPRNQWDKLPVAKTSWTLLRDCYLCPTMILKYDPREIAISVIFSALKVYGQEIPNADANDKTPWWKIFYKEIRTERMLNIARQILEVYDT